MATYTTSGIRYTGVTGTITTPTGGKVICDQRTDGSWVWDCMACGRGGDGAESTVRIDGGDHLRTSALCAFRG